MLNILKLRTIIAFIATVLILNACGFQLRDHVALPTGVEPVFIHTQSSVAKELHKQLKVSGADIAKTPHTANHQIIISNIKAERRTAALGENARALEFLLLESLSVELRHSKGHIVWGPHRLTERKIIQNDPNRVASISAEENILRQEMRKNLAANIIRQLHNVKLSKIISEPAKAE